MVDLLKLESGETSYIVGFKGGREFLSRMASMGLTIGSEIKVLQNYGKGPIIVLSKNTRIALGRGEAQKIIVGEPSKCRRNLSRQP
ncbi:MAG: ferrous iron transport protein A [Acidobacteria bacterium]|nr:ferrous iron transport protein A [Acidobacteriota bacterium]